MEFLFLIFINIFAGCTAWFCSLKVTQKKNIVCSSFHDIDNIFLSRTTKFKFRKLNKTDINKNIKSMFKKIRKPMFTDKILIDNKNYLLALSKFVEYKINNTKQTYRSKSKFILIEQISSTIAIKIINTLKCNLFFEFKLCIKKYNLRQKEIKIFKMLIAKNLLEQIAKIEGELCEISKVIQKAKNAKYIKKYRKLILNSANLYSIYKFNQNSFKLLYGLDKKILELTKKLFAELIESEFRLKIAVTYLKVLFC